LGGVIGGLDSGITEATTDVVLESASFDPSNNRRTAEDFGLRTEATLRFEKGLRPYLPPLALRRATQLIQQVAGGTVAKGIIDVYPEREKPRAMLLTSQRMKQVLGMEHSMKQAKSVLVSLGFEAAVEGDEALRASAPPWRSDITIEDDLVEEVARIVGYDSIPTEMLSTAIPHHEGQELRAFRERVRDLLVRQGLQETISYSAVGLDLLRKARITEDDAGLLAVSNPMSRDFKYMRPTLRASLMNTLSYNVARDARTAAIFEIGRVYLKRGEELPQEPEIAAGLLYGQRTAEGWLSARGSYDFYDAKGVVESLLERLGAEGEFSAHGDDFLHPGKAASVSVNGTVIGGLGEVHPLVTEAFEIDDGSVVYFELDLNRLFDALPLLRQSVKPLARFPASLRDISILVDRDVPAAQVQRIIEGQPLVEQTVLFDVYEGEEAPQGKVSLGYRIHFRAPNRTLSARDVNRSLSRVLSLLEREVGAVLRDGTEGAGG
jgi:phenylalanyl-tRNA synthetase beta chain